MAAYILVRKSLKSFYGNVENFFFPFLIGFPDRKPQYLKNPAAKISSALSFKMPSCVVS